MRASGRLSVAAAAWRYAEEVGNGAEIAARGHEGVWGWSSPAGRLRANRRARFLVDAARLGPGVRCLELGSGTGEFTSRLVESGCDLVAVELSEALAERCRERVRGRAEVVVGNVETGEGIQGRTFDAVVGVSILHHVNMDLCFRNTFRLLDAGGRFAFSEPNMANPQVWATKNVGALGRLRHETPHETAFRAGELRGLFEGAGLDVEICEPFDFLHPSTPRALIPAVRRLEDVLEKTPARRIAGSIRIAGRKP